MEIKMSDKTTKYIGNCWNSYDVANLTTNMFATGINTPKDSNNWAIFN